MWGVGTSGPASAQASSEVNRTTARAGSSSEVGTTVVIVEALCNSNGFPNPSFLQQSAEREREREKNPRCVVMGLGYELVWGCLETEVFVCSTTPLLPSIALSIFYIRIYF